MIFATLCLFMLDKSVQDEAASANDERWKILQAKVYEERVKSAFRYFRENGVEPILIKGWAAAIEYPKKHQRSFGDIDLCVAEQDYETSRRLVETDEGQRLIIDLHCGLRHLDTHSWQDLFENTVLKNIDDERIRVLRPEDHLRVLCVHWLTDGGADRERLFDIYHLVNNHTEDFDWERCLGQISSTRRDWVIKMIGATEKYLSLDCSRLPFSSAERRLPAWFVKALENEWAEETKLTPIQTTLTNPKAFWRQLKKRFPPNAIQSTIDMEGNFDDAGRLYYQLGSIAVRLKPSVKRIMKTIKIHLQARKKHS